jgi:chemotaxis-related protein WspB
MNVLVWTSGNQRYATPTRAVVEVVQVVATRPIPGAERWVKGLFDYRGELLPLLDADLLLEHPETEPRMSTRIQVICTDPDGDRRKRVGLVVQGVLGSEDLDFEDASAHPGLSTSGIDCLGPVALTPTGTVQLMEVDRIPYPQK